MTNGTQGKDLAVNQLGYLIGGRKTAAAVGLTGEVRLVDCADGRTVWTGQAGPAVEDAASGARVGRVDFSVWTGTGVYRLEAEDGASSPEFAVSDTVYEDAHRALLKAFYFFRCGTELTEDYAGPWTHGACHLSPAKVHAHPDRSFDACGGWHDAGDYGKYAGPGAKAVADLLLAYECYPEAFSRTIPLPESDGRTPDVLHECRYELEWLLRVQDAETGGVYHKVTTLRFPPIDTMPEEDRAELYASPVSATATGCFAGVTALASRVYAPFDPEFASRCLAAAERAWSWLEANPDVPGFKNPPDVLTGEYGDGQDADERWWAAAELYRATGRASYHQAFLRLAETKDFDRYELGWADMGGYGTLAYLLADREKEEALARRLREGWLQRAETLAATARKDGYGISLQPEQYIWGSNMLVLNNAMLLLLADRLAGENRYADTAAAHIHYLFGMNPVGLSYVTGCGTDAVRHPHHRPSAGDGVEAPVPGLVSGGPNAGLQDEYASAHLQGRAPALCFADAVESYATNEVTIYWNSPAVFVLSHFIKG